MAGSAPRSFRLISLDWAFRRTFLTSVSEVVDFLGWSGEPERPTACAVDVLPFLLGRTRPSFRIGNSGENVPFSSYSPATMYTPGEANVDSTHLSDFVRAATSLIAAERSLWYLIIAFNGASFFSSRPDSGSSLFDLPESVSLFNSSSSRSLPKFFSFSRTISLVPPLIC